LVEYKQFKKSIERLRYPPKYIPKNIQ
jgi:hypothetical protein